VLKTCIFTLKNFAELPRILLAKVKGIFEISKRSDGNLIFEDAALFLCSFNVLEYVKLISYQMFQD
jgi:hypothetical protein